MSAWARHSAERTRVWRGPAAGLAAASVGVAVGLPAMYPKLAGAVSVDEPPLASDNLAIELDRRLTQDVAPILAKYCVTCHEGEEAPGDLRLDGLESLRDVLAGDFDARLIREMVSSGTMPPKRKPQPSEHERIAVEQWLDAVLSYVPPDAAIDPGWFTIHRLNRAEYRNTLRDLLGIDPEVHDIAARLPRDDTGYGFDNVADVLSTSPLAVEAYLATAESAVEIALGPVVELGDVPRVLRPLAGNSGQPLARGGFFLFSNGAAHATFTAPITGEYLIRCRVWETHAGDEFARARLSIGGRTIEEFTVTGKREEPQERGWRRRLTRGEHEVAVRFLNDYYVKGKADRNLGVESISIAGPLDEATTERPGAWGRVFAPGGHAAREDERAALVLGAFAGRAYRRPATGEEIDLLLGVYRSEREAGAGFEPAVRTALSAALVSPNFLFRSVAHPDAADPEARYTLDGYELASRLSYFLWSSMPDEALLGAAADGSLVTDEGLAREVRRMLGDPRVAAFIENFAGQWLQLRGLESLEIDRASFPEYDDALRRDMIAEATLFLGDVLRSGRSVLEFIDSGETFLNDRLAGFYGVPGVEGGEFRRVALPEGSARGGVLTMGAVLTLTSNTTRTSPVKRGLFVLDQILGAPPPPPPPDIPRLEQAESAGSNATVRQRLAAHTADSSCAACHRRLDPIGLSFEHFDAIGRWRDVENGVPIDASGTLPDGSVLAGSDDLKRTLMARADQFVEALCAKTLTYAVGRGMEPFDRPAVRAIARRTRERGDSFPAMIESIVLSKTFRTCRGREPAHD